jgi:hypothetical protein
MKPNNCTRQDGICPRCHAKLDWLAFSEDRAVTGEFRDGIHYEVDSWPIGEESMTYECPKCGHLLFRDEREASAFLGRDKSSRRGGRSKRTSTNPGTPNVNDRKPVGK